MVHKIVLGLLTSILQCCSAPRLLSDYIVSFFPFMKNKVHHYFLVILKSRSSRTKLRSYILINFVKG